MSERAVVSPPPSSNKNYTHSYWKNGYYRQDGDGFPNILCFETGAYGFAVDIADLTKARFGLLDDDVGYEGAMKKESRSRMDGLVEENLVVEESHSGKTYRAVSCTGGTKTTRKPMDGNVWRWESGQLVQHYALKGLVLKLSGGDELPCDATLVFVVWPDSVTMSLRLAPPEGSSWRGDIAVRLHFKEWKSKEMFSGEWASGTTKSTTMNCNLDTEERTDLEESTELKVVYSNDQPIQTKYDRAFNCHYAYAAKLKRSFKGGMVEIRDYDEFTISVTCKNNSAVYVPFVLHVREPANITGLCPVLCAPDGTPTGTPVQLSKNWHYRKMGSYMRAYTLLPAAPSGTTKYMIRIPYGFYGPLPSASAANLSLVGYNGHSGQWEQLAIGASGETLCMDMDKGCCGNTITDIRTLFIRYGSDGPEYKWSDAGWGGDWLSILDPTGNKLYQTGFKTAYLSQGPCLTDAVYQGCYGNENQVNLRASVQTLRTDDYSRTFFTMEYEFNSTLPIDADKVWLFRMGPSKKIISPTLAYGNLDGLLEEHKVPNGLKRSSYFVQQKELGGSAPFWVSFPGAKFAKQPGTWGTGSRHFAIRSYNANIGGKVYTNPTLSFQIFETLGKDKLPNLDMRLVLPKGVTELNDGDTVSFEIELFILPKTVDDYYGPNEVFKSHMAANPMSWRTAYREAKGNHLKVKCDGGTVEHGYPLRIRATASKVVFEIIGGIGAVPVQFIGLDSPDYRMTYIESGEWTNFDQSVHGNDYWQSQYDPKEKKYGLTFNIPMDERDIFTGILSRK